MKRKTKRTGTLTVSVPKLHEVAVLNKCARCGGHHLGLTFFPFMRPPKTGGRTMWTHYAPCPKTHEPILMRKT